MPGRLIPDPSDPIQMVYASGDLGYRRDQGAMVIVGRADRQIKVNGMRIEPSETEAALRYQPEVRDAVLLVRHAPAAPTLLASW